MKPWGGNDSSQTLLVLQILAQSCVAVVVVVAFNSAQLLITSSRKKREPGESFGVLNFVLPLCFHCFRILEHLTVPSTVGQPPQLLTRPPSGGLEPSDSSLSEPSEIGRPPEPSDKWVEDITAYVFKHLLGNAKGEKTSNWQLFWGKPGHYVQLRKHLQIMMISGREEGISNCVQMVLSLLVKATGDHLANWRYLSCGLPIIAILSQFATVTLCSSFESLASTLSENSRSVRNLFVSGFQSSSNSSDADPKISALTASASLLLRNLEEKLISVHRTASANSQTIVGCIPNVVHVAALKMGLADEGTRASWRVETLSASESITAKVLGAASVNRIEALLRVFLRQKLSFLWNEFGGLGGSSGSGALSIPMISKSMVSLLRQWSSKDDLRAEVPKPSPALIRDQIEYSGCYGLIMEVLGFLDPELQSEGLLTSILDLSLRHQPESRVSPSRSCTVPVALTYLLHGTSWKTLSKAFDLLLGKELNSGTSMGHKPALCENGDHGHTSGDAKNSFYGQEAVMEFICLCFQHPRAKLVRHLYDKVEFV